jgi:adenine-specific DNA-methyltransferase
MNPEYSPMGGTASSMIRTLARPVLPEREKELGAYYTDAIVAEFLLRWAISTSQATVFDPSFGGGAFLAAAADRVHALGGNPASQIYGVELDPSTYSAFASGHDGVFECSQLVCRNFFELQPGDLPAVDAVVGNPPFIRYQQFTGQQRHAALACARRAGVTLSRLTSSWAPFIIHSAEFVKLGGRLGMVAPFELAHAGYARPVLDYLCRSFRRIRLLTFQRKLFRDLSEDTVLILAEGRGAPAERLELIDLPGIESLSTLLTDHNALPIGVAVAPAAICSGEDRLLRYLLPERARELYRELSTSPHFIPLGVVADVGIGYVTGKNNFFHVNEETMKIYRLPEQFLRPAVRRGGDLAGVRFTQADWRTLHEQGNANLLLMIPPDARLPTSLKGYLAEGEENGVPDHYKCLVRDPWYTVPHVYEADGFLTYMSGGAPKLVANEAKVVAPNALHIVRLFPLAQMTALGLATMWQTSLSALSCELEGHSLGGGMLKLEPTEARQVVVPLPELASERITELADDLDQLLRRGEHEAARQHADRAILRAGLGLSESEVQALREGWIYLRDRRNHR